MLRSLRTESRPEHLLDSDKWQEKESVNVATFFVNLLENGQKVPIRKLFWELHLIVLAYRCTWCCLPLMWPSKSALILPLAK